MPSTQPFVTYFEATWMNGPYPHQIWNHYQAALNDEPRTNNFSEGSNYSLNVAVACNNPSPARLVDSLVAFNSETELVILQGMTGLEQKRKILKRYRDLNQRELSTGLSQCTNGLLLQINRPFKLCMNRFSLCDL